MAETMKKPPLASSEMMRAAEEKKEKMLALYGENKTINDGNYDKSLAVKCVNGTFVGKREDGALVYRGIPFVGEQPVGADLRWKPPVDYIADDGVYEAYYNGKCIPQPKGGGEIGDSFVQGEDGLYLNIWKADEASGQKKPVMVWIHGGGFMGGGTVDPLYQCDTLIRENPDIIFVTIAYRLGGLGFLYLSHLPDGAEYDNAGNMGLLDQLQALKWIHENIAGFGGDPDNVTIFGESAGASSVSLLPLIKGSHDYIKRVIAQSGSSVLSRTTEQAIAATNQVMGMLGCKTVAELRKVPLDRLLETCIVLGMRNIGPVRDGKLLPEDVYKAYADGTAADIEIMQGCNKDEFYYFLHMTGRDSFIPWIAGMKEDKLAQMTEEDRKLAESFCANIKGDVFEPACRFMDQVWFNAPLIRQSEMQAKAGGKSFTYYFTSESPDQTLKCGHAVELSVVFGKPEVGKEEHGMEVDETFAKTLRKMWTQFARTGDPSLSVDISPDGKSHAWPPYDPENMYVMVFDEADIHTVREPEVGIVDRERTYPLTRYLAL